MRLRLFIIVIASVGMALVSGCPTAQVVSSPPPRVDQADPQIAGCLVAKDPLNPFIVEWPGTEKVALEVASKEGLVAVSYVSCYLKVLRGCKGVGQYEVREANAAVDGFEITNQTDLYARLPLGAASLQAELSSGNGLRLNYLATGQKVAKAPLQKLDGDCSSATHYVRAMTVGAYSLDAMSSGAAAGGAGIGGLGAGAGRKETARRIRGQGNIEQCHVTGRATRGCDAILQIELQELPKTLSTIATQPSSPSPPTVDLFRPQTPTASFFGAAAVEWIYSKPAKIYFAKTETTMAQYRACVTAGRCTKPMTKDDNRRCNWGYSDRDDHPINCVDWNQAASFCEWAGGRLPTEDEWYAEASNNGTRQYPWGDGEVNCSLAVMDDKWSRGNGCGKDSTWPVCSKTAGNSVSGLCDVSGNVWEWTSSWYDSSQNSRAVRGGSWSYDSPVALRTSGRDWLDPSGRNYYSGFRCAGAAQ